MKTEYLTFEQKLTRSNTSKEGGGCARIAEINKRVLELRQSKDQDTGIWIKVISWDSEKKHEEFKDLLKAKKIRITIETIT